MPLTSAVTAKVRAVWTSDARSADIAIKSATAHAEAKQTTSP